MSAFDTHPTLTAYASAPPLGMWLEANQPGQTMLWRDGFQHQVQWMAKIAPFGVHMEPRVLATHRSKSIDLPVPAILLGNPASEWAVAMLRDNLHDVNVAVVSNVPLTIDHALVSEQLTREEYQSSKQRAKDSRMMGRITDAQWEDGSWLREWSGASVTIEDGKIWVSYTAFAEGISRVPGVSGDQYTPGCMSFTNVLPSAPDGAVDAFGNLVKAIKAGLYS
jgi:hypothetical protein